MRLATGLSIAALVVSVVGLLGLVYARAAAAESRRSADAAEAAVAQARRSADASEAADRRQRTPTLAIERLQRGADLTDRIIYRVRNEGPQDLTEVVIHRPRVAAGAGVPDGLKYRLAVTGKGDFAEDEIRLGPLTLAQEVQFTLGVGNEINLPEFRVVIECSAGKEAWPLIKVLPRPR